MKTPAELLRNGNKKHFEKTKICLFPGSNGSIDKNNS